MIHILADERGPIGRPPIVREKVLSTLRTLKRASVSRLEEETGCKEHSIQHVLRTAHKAGESERSKERGGTYRTFYVYGVKT